MDDKLASTGILLLHGSLPADSCCLFHSVMFIAFMHYGVTLPFSSYNKTEMH